MNTAMEELEAASPSPRRPWLAALASVTLPGLGQVYNGQINRGLWVFLIFALFSIPALTLGAVYLPDWAMLPVVLCSALIALGTWVHSVFHAWRTARNSGEYWCRPWQSSGLYVALFLVCNIILLPIALNYVRQHQVQAFHIPSNSMSPTLLPGDYLFADMRYNCPTCAVEVTRGDVVIFVFPNNRNRYHVKRVVGMPGDRLALGKEGVTLLEAEPARELERSLQDQTTVPPGHVFVSGDNVEQSQDSRDYGPVALSDIAGKATQIWFSRSTEGVRWGRIGQLVQ